MKKCWSIVLLCLYPFLANSQDDLRSGYFETSMGFNQVKDALNYGFVYTGPLIPFQYGHRKSGEGHLQNFKLGFAMAYYGADGMNGGAVYVQPLEYQRLFPITKTGLKLSLGPVFQFEYQFNLYPEMQSGHMLWMTNYSIGIGLLGSTELKGKKVEISLQNSVLNLTSRPKTEIDPYYYTTSFFDWLKIGNENLQLGSFSSYNATRWRFEIFQKGAKRTHTFFYQGDYQVYSEDPGYKRFTNALGYRLFFKKHQE